MNDNGGRWTGWLTFGVCLVIVLTLGGIAWFAPWGIDCLAGEPEQAKACSETARNIGLSVAGGFGAIIAVIALHFNARRTHTDRLRLTNDTYVKAIEQLRSDSVEVRVGGMYALKQIAKDEQRYHYWPVIETLSAYIRERAPWPPREKETKGLEAVAAAIVSVGGAVAERLPAAESARSEPKEAGEPPETRDATGAEPARRAPTDIQTALTIIGQLSQQRRKRAQQAPKHEGRLRKWRKRLLPRSKFVERWADAGIAQLERVRTEPTRLESGRIDWRHTDLRHADLMGANLTGAVLTGAVLTDADLRDAVLTGADLRGADLRGADLRGAVLRRANLMADANLRGAILTDAILTDAFLMGADLRGADLGGADLIGAFLLGANLSDAFLLGAKFSQHPKELRAYWNEAKPPKSLDAIIIETG